MKIAIIDADLIGRKKHRFPNLACMKLSGYHRDAGDEVILKLIRRYTSAIPKFYCFTGFDRNDRWDADFWRQDIFDLLARIELLMKYRCLPYIMRFARYKESPYRGVYITIARCCNQPSFYNKEKPAGVCQYEW